MQTHLSLTPSRIVTIGSHNPFRLTAVVIALQSYREHCLQESLDGDGILTMRNAADFDAVGIVNWVNGRIMAKPVKPFRRETLPYTVAHLEKLWCESKYVHPNSP